MGKTEKGRKNMIQEIELSKLKIHPKNVRKTYNGIDELAESIKAQGILQNLSVVPDPEEAETFLVVIGNRRLLAARKAGLKTVPCSVTEMEEKQQASVMLLENMQRNDLTVYEEATGFQLCLDLGMTEAELSQETGLSKRTIKHRTKLLALDQEVFEKKASEGATIFDFTKLERIKDVSRRNKVMQFIGTDNFARELQNAVCEETCEKNKKEFRKHLASFAKEITGQDDVDCSFVRWYSFSGDKPEVPEDMESSQYYFREDGNGVFLYKEIEVTEEARARNAEQERQREEKALQRAKFEELGKSLFKIRKEFFLDKTRNQLTIEKCQRFIAILLLRGSTLSWKDKEDEKATKYGFCNMNMGLFSELLGVEKEKLHLDDVLKMVDKKAAPVLEKILYSTLEVGTDIRLKSWDMEYARDMKTELLYEFLMEMGYRLSDDEKMLLDGTHPYYKAEEQMAEAA